MISLGWLILIFILGALAYAAWIIKNEKNIFLKKSIPYQIGPFLIKTPFWWSIKKRNENLLMFERRDSKYEWYSSFSLKKEKIENLDEYLVNFIKNKKILFDPETSEVTSEFEKVFVSGTATEDGIDRIYYELALIKSKNEFLICESKSSILNGAVEGPYFEEVIKRITLS